MTPRPKYVVRACLAGILLISCWYFGCQSFGWFADELLYGNFPNYSRYPDV